MINKKSKVFKISAFLGAIVIGVMLLFLSYYYHDKILNISL